MKGFTIPFHKGSIEDACLSRFKKYCHIQKNYLKMNKKQHLLLRKNPKLDNIPLIRYKIM